MQSDSFKISGIIERILPPREGGQKKYQTIVLKTHGQYPQILPVEFGEKCMKYIEDLTTGEEVSCEFSLRGREWNGKYFASLSGFKIFKGDQPHQRNSSSKPARDYKLDEPGQSPTAGSTYRGKNAYVPPADDSDDLSF